MESGGSSTLPSSSSHGSSVSTPQPNVGPCLATLLDGAEGLQQEHQSQLLIHDPLIESLLLSSLPENSPETPIAITSGFETINPTILAASQTNPMPFEVLPAAWPPALPPPPVLNHLVETFFTCVPLASRLIHKPTFMAALQHSPTSLEFPYVLHQTVLIERL